MRSTNSNIIILGSRNIREADKLLFVYSKEHGKLKLLAKGARRHGSKFMGHLETLNIANAQIYFGPHSTILTEIKTITGSKCIRENMISLLCALQIAEITEQSILENQEIAGLYSLLEETITHLGKNRKMQLIVTSFTIKLLNLLGLIPSFKEINTRLPQKYQNFFEYVKLSAFEDLLKIRINEQDENIIKDITKRLLEYQNQRDFKSLRFSLSMYQA